MAASDDVGCIMHLVQFGFGERIRDSGTDVLINLTTGPGARFVPGKEDPEKPGPGTTLHRAEKGGALCPAFRAEHSLRRDRLRPGLCARKRPDPVDRPDDRSRRRHRCATPAALSVIQFARCWPMGRLRLTPRHALNCTRHERYLSPAVWPFASHLEVRAARDRPLKRTAEWLTKDSRTLACHRFW
jgi:hypothetical protein